MAEAGQNRHNVDSFVVGVLALQGAFSEHIMLLRQAFAALAAEGDQSSWSSVEVRTPQQLAACDALIIPGGESTAIALVASRCEMLEPLRNFVKYVHVLCSCAYLD
jgi:5'-phosphate synthase pdxT subunit